MLILKKGLLDTAAALNDGRLRTCSSVASSSCFGSS